MLAAVPGLAGESSKEDAIGGTFSNDSSSWLCRFTEEEGVGGSGGAAADEDEDEVGVVGAGGVDMTGLTFLLTAGDSLTMDRGGTGMPLLLALPRGSPSPLRLLCSTTWWYCFG